MRSLTWTEIKRLAVENKAKDEEEREEQDVGRSRSHGGLRDLVVEVAHFP